MDLKATIGKMLAGAGPAPSLRPKALIVPHAGFPYSGPIAACAYQLLQPVRAQIRKVVLFGPAHRVYLSGMALPSATHFQTPLGEIPLDQRGVTRLLELPQVESNDTAHALEHSLEVQLPFLQVLLDEFELLPVVVGQCAPALVAEALEAIWGGDETLIVVSSDLSHFHAYPVARVVDSETSALIEARRSTLDGEQACGAHAINGLMLAARAHGLHVNTLDLANSGDTAGDKHRVVGYGAYALA